MKLLTSITRKYLVSTLVVLIGISVSTYFILTSLLRQEIDERLDSMCERLEGQFNGGELTVWPFIEVRAVSALPSADTDTLRDVTIYNPREREDELFRERVAYRMLHGEPHRIVVRLAVIEREDLILLVSGLLTAGTGLLLLALVLINRHATASVLAPFHHTIARAQEFSVKAPAPPDLGPAEINEFRELNAILTRLMTRAHADYHTMREFAGNASHEFQTPLAVFRAKLDLLIQNETLGAGDRELIDAMYQNISRLRHLTKALLLLSQIETEGYFESEEVDVAETVRAEAEVVRELVEHQTITVTSSIEGPCRIVAHPALALTLVRNLLSNAVRHNAQDGWIDIRCMRRMLIVENTGPEPPMAPERLFERFTKSANAKDSVGLGLAIVREICTLYSFDIAYTYKDGLHRVCVTFPMPPDAG